VARADDLGSARGSLLVVGDEHVRAPPEQMGGREVEAARALVRKHLVDRPDEPIPERPPKRESRGEDPELQPGEHATEHAWEPSA
jgi:hypothetical protein